MTAAADVQPERGLPPLTRAEEVAERLRRACADPVDVKTRDEQIEAVVRMLASRGFVEVPS